MLLRKAGKLAKVLVIVTMTAVIVIASVILAGGFTVSRFFSGKSPEKSVISEAQGHDLVLEDNGAKGYTAADFEAVILGKAENLSKMIVYTRALSQKATVTDTAIFNIDALSKKQDIRYHGNSVWTVDLSKLGKGDISVDNSKKTVTITVPSPQCSITLNSENTKFGKVQKKKLVYGDVKITPEQTQSLEMQAINNMYASVSKSDDNAKACKAAEKTIESLFDSLIGSVAPGYEAKVIFG